MSPLRVPSIVAITILCAVSAAARPGVSSGRTLGTQSDSKERAHTVLSTQLPRMKGDHLQATLVEVNYGPGESSPPHSHPCPVVVYVVSGSVRSQVKGRPEATYKAGDSFYEPPNGVHLVSANASQTAAARLVAFFVCDHTAPLSGNPVGGNK